MREKKHRVLLATGNQGKVKELEMLLENYPVEIVSLVQVEGVTAVDETGVTFEENSALKAKGYATQTGLLTLADDSGLEVDALDGNPGVFSARYAGEGATDGKNNDKLLRALEGVQGSLRTARFRCVLSLAEEDGEILHQSQGACEGEIVAHPSGNSGFGYDPVFRPTGYNKTMAELTRDEKNAISHRGQAFQQMLLFLISHLQLESP